MQRFLWCLLALGMLGGGQANAESSYIHSTLDAPGFAGTAANGINDAGQIVGYVVDANGVHHAFLLSGGSYTTFDVPGSTQTYATGINNAGQIVGFYSSPDGINHGFLLSGGNYTTLDVPGANGTYAEGINSAGQVVGGYSTVTFFNGSFLYSSGNYTTLAVLGSSVSTAYGINDSGQIVGFYEEPANGRQHGYVYSSGNYTTVDVPGSENSGVSGINNTGQLVGGYSGRLAGHGFLLSGTNHDTVDAPGASSTSATGINTAGQIVGYYVDTGGILHGFVATPVAGFVWHGSGAITTGVSGNPSLVQALAGTYGAMGNYELVVPLSSGMAHFYRNNDDPSRPWNGPYTFATDQGPVDAVGLIQSNFSSAGNGPGNLAVVARIGDQLVYYYREDVTFTWQGPSPITTGVTGVPSFVQARPGSFGTKGNYQLVVPLQTGGVAHFYRDNDDPNFPWVQTATFGADLGLVDAVSMVQSNFSTAGNGPGNLAVVARIGNNLVYFYRDDVAPFTWHGPVTITTGVTGTPSFIQAKPGTYGTMGNYELAVPLVVGGVAHLYRNNDDSNLPWAQTSSFGTDLDRVDAVSLVQSNFSTTGNGPGNLAAVTLAGAQLNYFYHDD
jgi:probable HAF family extracellular repeat protein